MGNKACSYPYALRRVALLHFLLPRLIGEARVAPTHAKEKLSWSKIRSYCAAKFPLPVAGPQ